MNENTSYSENHESLKSERFRKNEKLSELIIHLKEILKPQQKIIEKQFDKSKWPIGLIVGAPRSGTTLILQWFASLGCFSYPSNFLTRFAYAPYIGILIQKILFDKDYDFHGDFYDIHSEVNFKSDLGKSKGALATNEFQHFFRNYMPNFVPKYLNDSELNSVDTSGISKGLASIENAFEKPFVTKGFMLQFNLNYFFSKIPNLFIINIERDTLMNMQSIYIARQEYLGTKDLWVSVKPKEYPLIKDFDVFRQIAGQIFFTRKSINDSLQSIPKQNKITIKYEDFCKSPVSTYKDIFEKYNENGFNLNPDYKGIGKFEISDKKKISNDEALKFEKAYNFFVNKDNDYND